MSVIAIKLLLSCLWYCTGSVSTNMFSDCRNLIALKPINSRWIVATKCTSSETVQSLGCHDRHPLPRVCLREPGSRDVINGQWRYVIRAQMICYRNNKYLHDIPECLLVKNYPTPSGLPIPVANKIQNAIQYKDRSPDWWCLAHTMTSAQVWGHSNRLLMAAICNTGVAVVLTC